MRNSARLDAVGATVGVEEEYHLVDPVTVALRPVDPLAEAVAAGTAGARLRPEMLTSQLEAATEVCADLDAVRSAIGLMRAEARAAAEEHGATILATSTHPFASLTEIRVAPRERYARLGERFGAVVGTMNLTGCHVHVSVPDLDVAVAVMTHARPYLPLLAALTGSSPFHEGVDTGYESFRLAWLALWPHGGTPPPLRTGAEYLALVDELRATGVVGEPGELLWELRPSSRYPTLEFRVADVCTDVEDAVLLAGVVRALTRTLAQRALAGTPSARVADPVLRAARWRAARYGLADDLWDPSTRRLAPAAAAVRAMLEEIAPALQWYGDEAAVRERVAELLARGTSARRQRACVESGGTLQDAVRDAVGRT